MQGMENLSFGAMLRYFRGRTVDKHTGKPLSQGLFALKVSEETDVHITRNTVNNWENDKSYFHPERNRMLLIGILITLFKFNGITTPTESNQLLESGGFKRLTESEINLINPDWMAKKDYSEGEKSPPSSEEQLSRESRILVKMGTDSPPIPGHQPPSALTSKRGIAELINLFAKVLFALLEHTPDWLLGTESKKHRGRQDVTAKANVHLIDPNCGSQPINLRQQRLKISDAFGSYFTGLLEKTEGYVNIQGQIDLPEPNNTSGLDAFQQIYWLLHRVRGPDVLLIAAEGGMGKSTLTAKIIRCLYSDEVFDLLLGDSAKSRLVNPLTGAITEQQAGFTDLESFLQKVSAQLGLDYEIGTSNIQKAVRDIKDRLDRRRAILVLDNLETVEKGAQLLDILRQLSGRDVRILVTTRKIAGINHQTPGVLLVQLRPIQEISTAHEFLHWHISTHAPLHPELSKLLLDLKSSENLQLLIQKTGGIPLLMQLVLSDIARSSWSRLDALPTLFGAELLNFLYQERWVELGTMGAQGENARALLFHILEQSSHGRITFANLLQWATMTHQLESVDEPLRLLQERFLILNSDFQQGNFSIFPSLAEFLWRQHPRSQ